MNPAAYLRRAIANLASNQRRGFARWRVAINKVGRTEEGRVAEYSSDLSDLLRVPPEGRAVLYLVEVEGRPYAEAAALLGISEEAARARASRARKRLRLDLEGEQSWKDEELKGRLEHLSTRGEPRGARPVLEAAQSRATEPPPSALRRAMPTMAMAAAVSLIAGVAGAMVMDDGTDQRFATGPIGTVPTETTAVPVEISIPAKLISQSRLVPYSNCGAYTSYMKEQGLAKVTPYGLPSIGGGFTGGPSTGRGARGPGLRSRRGGVTRSAAPRRPPALAPEATTSRRPTCRKPASTSPTWSRPTAGASTRWPTAGCTSSTRRR